MIAFLKVLFARWWAARDPIARDRPRQPEPDLDDLRRQDELVSRPRRPVRPAGGRPWIYVCCPDMCDPRAMLQRVRKVCRAVAAAGEVPIAPHVYLPAFLDLPREHPKSLAICFELISACHELRVYGGTVTQEMRWEIDYAVAVGLPVRFVELAS